MKSMKLKHTHTHAVIGQSPTKKDVNNETPIAIKKILMPIDRSGYREKILAYGISLGKAWGRN